MKKLTFKQIIEQHNFHISAYKLIYYLSPTVKDLNSYQKNKDLAVDFDINEYQKLYTEVQENNKPIERVTGKVFFCKHEFILLDDVFCPRHETESMVDYVNSQIKSNPELKKSSYIDLCSGTGVVGISVLLANENNLKKATLVDISEKATENIKKNLTKHKLKATVITEDWYECIRNNNFEIITANFPYVSRNDEIEDGLLDNEPPTALFAEKDGWEHYDKMIAFMNRNRNWKLVVMECSAYHEMKWKGIAKSYSRWKWKPMYDLNGKLRLVSIMR
ncbi:methyltransferase [Candidatus Mycoplasma haematobovis]|uniref:peptide chain release factor N(5)-glutamine methyltransferase n=1 Tax=Candidatus Mycoplasma haematobovis TaxID=432608 RepID=A0A1A9QFF1_9MOLU|nr:methyltransferase [Candidatus Mycoplasma haematobovis]